MMAAECDVQSEIEVLESIYLDELQADRTTDGGWEVSLVLHPSTAEDAVSQFVRLTLTLTLDQQYPSSPPAISIRNPRGLSDDQLCSVHRSLQSEARNSLGSPVLYQLIEKAKEILTESNIPHGNCVICLYGFKEGEAFTKTGCYHYFHSHCLGRYVSHSEAELRRREAELQEDKTREGARPQDLSVVCPVCREPLDYDLQQLLSSAAPQLPELDRDALGSDFQQKWAELQELLDRQRARGGVIDPEQESTRFLIRIQETPAAEPGQQEGAAPPEAPSPEDVAAPPTGPRRFPAPPRGPRRARRGGAGPLPERLQKLTLPSDCSPPPPGYHGDGPLGSRGPGEAFEDPSGSEDPKEAEPAGGRGHRGRRRGSHYPAPHAGASRPLPRRRWDGHAPRGGAHRGHAHRGRHGNGLQPQAAERGREEVL